MQECENAEIQYPRRSSSMEEPRIPNPLTEVRFLRPVFDSEMRQQLEGGAPACHAEGAGSTPACRFRFFSSRRLSIGELERL